MKKYEYKYCLLIKYYTFVNNYNTINTRHQIIILQHMNVYMYTEYIYEDICLLNRNYTINKLNILFFLKKSSLTRK